MARQAEYVSYQCYTLFRCLTYNAPLCVFPHDEETFVLRLYSEDEKTLTYRFVVY